MVERKRQAEKQIIILCVDRDDDLGAKAEIKTPIVGRKESLNAAVALALRDAEEPDANAMFEAIHLYDDLISEKKPEETFEIATISGSRHGGVEADRKIVAELNELLASFSADEIILVTDGYSDEAVLPLLESRVAVTSVRRIVMKHSESIEETAALLSRYLRMIVENPRYSRIALGLPGLLLLILGILSIFNLLYYYWIAFIFVVSVFMVVKGFGVDKTTKNIYKWIDGYSPPPLRVQISAYTAAVGAICALLGMYLGYEVVARANIPTPDPASWLGALPRIAGHFLKGSVTLIVAGVCVALLGRAIRWYIERDSRLLRNSALIVTIGWSRQIFDGASDLLISPQLTSPDPRPEKLIFSILIGVLIGIASVLVIVIVRRSAGDFFRKTREQVGELEED